MCSGPLLKSVNAVLFEHWDPIGVRSIDVAWPDDEYERYAPGLVVLVKQGASNDAIAEHLGMLETERMSIGPSPAEHRLAVARMVRAIVDEFGGSRDDQ
jgi:hypothetical protein